MNRPLLSAMGGALVRQPAGWHWRDGRAEPRVLDVTALEAFAFPRVTRPSTTGSGALETLIALPRKAIDEEPELHEAIAMAGDAARSPEDDPAVCEIPWALWEPWARSRVIGLRWDAADEEALLAEAEKLRRR